ncbi:hypothetical protein [Sphingomonas hengshuiensis]|uniref:Uncharacterized protein n=1 Tax=Sphingomonas hengshuiensis TaxID=1609977 RepID=A0A7U4LEI7_9SPHN|nr:hypothetical protein [Sphingomonas hengshuiensis]AJP71248.1 hypothetical protein TS85_04660 [Sphingomonas hengshuiensis]
MSLQPHTPAPRPGLHLAALILFGLMLAGCDRTAPEQAANAQAETPAPTMPKLPAPVPALSRGDLIAAAARAASAFAEGKPSEGTDPLVGRTFSVRIAFGCTGPASGGPQDEDLRGVASWTPGPDGKTIELRMTPGDWAGSALIAAGTDAPAWEAVEGFWIPRPWLDSESCPVVKGDPLQTGELAAAPQTLGLAAIFEEGGSRIGRRNGRAYTFTVRATGDTPLPAPNQGYRMVLQGRIASFPDGRAIRCRAPGVDQRPVCVVATKLDRVAFEDSDGAMLSEWRPG